MPLPASILYGKVTWEAVEVGASLDGDAIPDTTAVAGRVTFTPPDGVALVNDSARPVTAFLRPVTFGVDAAGVLRDGDGNVGVTLVSPESPGLSRQGWTWQATFDLDGLARAPFPFRLPAGATVDLTRAAPVAFSAGVPIIAGPPGPAADPETLAAELAVAKERANHTGTQPAETIGDSTTLGRAVLTAATAAAARTAIGAGTSSLGLGAGPTTAAPGNHGHTGTASLADTFTVVGTTSGAYPTSRPAGAGRVWFDDPAVTPPAWAVARDRWASA